MSDESSGLCYCGEPAHLPEPGQTTCWEAMNYACSRCSYCWTNHLDEHVVPRHKNVCEAFQPTPPEGVDYKRFLLHHMPWLVMKHTDGRLERLCTFSSCRMRPERHPDFPYMCFECADPPCDKCGQAWSRHHPDWPHADRRKAPDHPYAGWAPSDPSFSRYVDTHMRLSPGPERDVLALAFGPHPAHDSLRPSDLGWSDWPTVWAHIPLGHERDMIPVMVRRIRREIADGRRPLLSVTVAGDQKDRWFLDIRLEFPPKDRWIPEPGEIVWGVRYGWPMDDGCTMERWVIEERVGSHVKLVDDPYNVDVHVGDVWPAKMVDEAEWRIALLNVERTAYELRLCLDYPDREPLRGLTRANLEPVFRDYVAYMEDIYRDASEANRARWRESHAAERAEVKTMMMRLDGRA